MFGKKELAVACALAFASAAVCAADFEVYGVIDTSLVFESVNADDGAGRDNSLYMSSGEEWGSRWGIRGKENLGNGYVVGFDLQSGIRTDDGTSQYGRLFARESSLYVKGPFGKITAGRMDALIGTRTSAGKMAVLSSFGDGYGPYIGCLNNVMSEHSYVDNALFYESPVVGGFTGRLQYAMGDNNSENKASTDRYLAGTLMYAKGALSGFFGVDRTLYGHKTGEDADDSLTVTAGGKYDFGTFSLHAGLQYFKEVRSSTIRKFIWSGVPEKLTGWGATISAGVPVGNGKVIAALAYMDADNADSVKTSADVKRKILSAGYQYDLSKRSHLYAIASCGEDEVKTGGVTAKPNYYKAVAGLRHLF